MERSRAKRTGKKIGLLLWSCHRRLCFQVQADTASKQHHRLCTKLVYECTELRELPIMESQAFTGLSHRHVGRTDLVPIGASGLPSGGQRLS